MRQRESALHAAGYSFVVGIDEAGRGPLAGPVVAAAVYLSPEMFLGGVKDSKQLSGRQREPLYETIMDQGHVGIGSASHTEIDQSNILQATFTAMKRAVQNLDARPEYCMVDGSQPIPDLDIPQEAIVRGDQSCFLIAAASIIAKVCRDRVMIRYDGQFPEYGFRQHKGYPTRQHRAALAKFGPSPIHRLSFRGVKRGKAI